MNKTTKIIIIILTTALLLAGGYIFYLEVWQDVIQSNYDQGLQDGQLLLAFNQYQNQECVFFNGSDVATLEVGG